MKAEELRIGNWVTVLSTVPCQVSAYHLLQMVSYKPKDPNEANYQEMTNPIPLTGEWLIKFGFKEYNGYWDLNEVLFDMGGIGTSSSDMTLHQSPDVPNFYSCYLGNYDPGLRYVHQLQNLYYVLKGEELSLLKETSLPPPPESAP